jgi:hypothetical protein
MEKTGRDSLALCRRCENYKPRLIYESACVAASSPSGSGRWPARESGEGRRDELNFAPSTDGGHPSLTGPQRETSEFRRVVVLVSLVAVHAWFSILCCGTLLSFGREWLPLQMDDLASIVVPREGRL